MSTTVAETTLRYHLGAIMQQVVYDELSFESDGERRGFFLFLIELRLNHRFYYYDWQNAESQLWKYLRKAENDYLLTLVGRIYSGFCIACQGAPGQPGVDLDAFRATLARGIAGAYGEKPTTGKLSDNVIADDAFMDKVTPVQRLIELFQDNPWLLMLIALERHLGAIIPQEYLNAYGRGSVVDEENTADT